MTAARMTAARMMAARMMAVGGAVRGHSSPGPISILLFYASIGCKNYKIG